ncbi:MAG: DUF2190 family protein [Cognatishimia sp.]
MKNFKRQGANVTITATAAIASGEFVKVGGISGVAQGAAAIGEDVVLVRSGVFELPKLAAQAWSKGDLIYWDASEGECTTVDTGNDLIGAADAPAANPSSVGDVLLDGVIR